LIPHDRGLPCRRVGTNAANVEAALTGSLGALATLFDSPLIRGLLFACAVLALLALVIDLAVPRRLPGSLTRRVIEELVGASTRVRRCERIIFRTPYYGALCRVA